jgi:hypothetical protein
MKSVGVVMLILGGIGILIGLGLPYTIPDPRGYGMLVSLDKVQARLVVLMLGGFGATIGAVLFAAGEVARVLGQASPVATPVYAPSALAASDGFDLSGRPTTRAPVSRGIGKFPDIVWEDDKAKAERAAAEIADVQEIEPVVAVGDERLCGRCWKPSPAGSTVCRVCGAKL